MSTDSAIAPAPTFARRDWLHTAMRTSLSISLAGAGLKATAQTAGPSPSPTPGTSPSGGMADRMLNRLLDGLDVSAEQRSTLQALAQRGRQDMEAGREPRQALRSSALAEWAKPQIDLAAIEGLRVQMTRLHDEGSRKMTALLAEAAGVLTPSQRVQVVQRLQHMPFGAVGRPGGPGGLGQRLR